MWQVSRSPAAAGQLRPVLGREATVYCVAGVQQVMCPPFPAAEAGEAALAGAAEVLSGGRE